MSLTWTYSLQPLLYTAVHVEMSLPTSQVQMRGKEADAHVLRLCVTYKCYFSHLRSRKTILNSSNTQLSATGQELKGEQTSNSQKLESITFIGSVCKCYN